MAPGTPLRTLLIVGSTRPGTTADLVLPWLQRTLEADDRIELHVEDLRNWPLPFFQEDPAAIGNPMDPTYSDPLVGKWNETVKAAEAVIMLTPEYNHSIPPALKNAIDSVFMSGGFRNKPCAFVGYSMSPTGGVRAIEHLIQAVSTLEAMPLRNVVLIGQVAGAFDVQGSGEPTSPVTGVAIQVLIDDLVWWGNALRSARAEGELPPGQFRMMQAMAALQQAST